MTFRDEPEVTGALTAKELAILARWDAGDSIEKIVRSGAFARGLVKATIYLFGSPEAEGARDERNIRAADRRYAAALAATGKRYA